MKLNIQIRNHHQNWAQAFVLLIGMLYITIPTYAQRPILYREDVNPDLMIIPINMPFRYDINPLTFLLTYGKLVWTAKEIAPGMTVSPENYYAKFTGTPTALGTYRTVTEVRDMDINEAAGTSFPMKVVETSPIPAQEATVGQPFSYTVDLYTFPNYIPTEELYTTPEERFQAEMRGLPAGLIQSAKNIISGTPTQPGLFMVSMIVYDGHDYDVLISFPLTVKPAQVTPTPLSLLAPTYDCQTGAFTFNTSGGDGTPIEYYAVPGITGWTTNPNQFVDAEMRTAADAPPIALRARQNGVETSLLWNIRQVCPVGNPQNPPTGAFSFSSVTTLSCEVLDGGERQVTFTPAYNGLTGQPITFWAVNESTPTLSTGPYTLRLYTDNPVITLKAQQANTASEASFTYNWLAACSTYNARLGFESPASLSASVYPNPVSDEATLQLSGGDGKLLHITLIDLQGRQLSNSQVSITSNQAEVKVPVHQAPGPYILRVSSGHQSTSLRLIKK